MDSALQKIVYTNGVAAERDRVMGLLRLTPDQLRLICGEMTAQEMRTVLALLAYLTTKVAGASNES